MNVSAVQHCSNPFAYNNEAIEISGCDLLPPGSSAGRSENGTYFRQVPQENVNDRPLFKKEATAEVSARYFFVSASKYWVCGNQCNEIDGVNFWSGVTSGSNTSGPPALKTFSYFPPYKKLTDMKVQMLTAADLAALQPGNDVPAAVPRTAAAAAAAAGTAAAAAGTAAAGGGAASSSSSGVQKRPAVPGSRSKGAIVDLIED